MLRQLRNKQNKRTKNALSGWLVHQVQEDFQPNPTSEAEGTWISCIKSEREEECKEDLEEVSNLATNSWPRNYGQKRG